MHQTCAAVFALTANVNLIQTAPFESGSHTISLPAYLRERHLWNSPIPAVDYALVLLGEIARQWRHEIDHLVQDFWRLLAICSEKVLLWGPTMGQLPVDVVIRLAERYECLLEAVAATDFTCTRPQDGYQKPCLSFFAERFVGYALLQELLQMGKLSRLPEGGITMARYNIGYCCTVAAGGVAPESYEIGRQ